MNHLNLVSEGEFEAFNYPWRRVSGKILVGPSVAKEPEVAT
jgi:hypothetical protein